MCSVLRLLMLTSIIGCVELISVSVPHKYVNVTMGGSVMLQCTFETNQPTTGLIIQWNFVSSTSSSSSMPQQLYYYQSGKEVIPKGYKDRLQASTSPNVTKNASITIRNMQTSDAGVYSCEVHNFPDVTGKSEASVIVKVLERPSAPYCAVHGDIETGHLVTLTCHSERGSPSPTYTWTRLDEAKTRRPVLGRTSPSGTLQIRNISEFQFGEYQCNASNAVGFSLCSVELTPDAGDGVIAGAVIGALLGCALIMLVVWYIAHTVRRRRYKAVKAPEADEMKRSSHQAREAAESVPVATTAGHIHEEADEPQA